MPNKLIVGFIALVLVGAGCGRAAAPADRAPAGPGSPPTSQSTSQSTRLDLGACLRDCETGPVQRACKANCYTDKALETSDLAHCDPLIEVGAQAEDVGGTGIDIGGFSFCINRFSEEKRQPSACDQLVASGKFSDFDRYICIANVARRYSDPSICNLLTDEIIQKPACIDGASQ